MSYMFDTNHSDYFWQIEVQRLKRECTGDKLQHKGSKNQDQSSVAALFNWLKVCMAYGLTTQHYLLALFTWF